MKTLWLSILLLTGGPVCASIPDRLPAAATALPTDDRRFEDFTQILYFVHEARLLGAQEVAVDIPGPYVEEFMWVLERLGYLVEAQGERYLISWEDRQ